VGVILILKKNVLAGVIVIGLVVVGLVIWLIIKRKRRNEG